MDAKQKLKEIAELIDKEVELALKAELKESAKISHIIEDFIEITASIPLAGGKRIRGAFMFYSYFLCGGKNRKEILKTSAFIELVHAYLLVHDDIQDRAALRRGAPTIHKIYQNIHEEDKGKKGALHFGEAVAINAGDVLNHLGMNILVNSKFPMKHKLNALNRLNRRIMDVGYGQTLDIFGEILENVNEEYVLEVQKYKTGFYTYETPLHIGAILAGADQSMMDALSKYALPGGIAFQIQDDILGVFGDEVSTGKSASSDIVEGKKTLLTIKAYEKASKKDKVILDNTLGNPHAKEDMLEAVKQIMVDTGSLDYSKELAKKLLTKSTKALLTKSDWNKDGLAFLIGINDYMYNRDL